MATALSARHPELLAYRDEFPLLSACTYLNTCSLGARSRRSDQRLRAVLDQWDRLGARAWYKHWLDELSGLREDLGWTIGAPGSQIALASSVSAALAVVGSLLEPIHRGEQGEMAELCTGFPEIGTWPRTKVVTTALDFPTIGHQWLAKGPLGVDVEVVPSADGLTVPVEAIAEAVDLRTALVATSHVYFSTGAVQDLPRLARVCHERGAFLLADGYQATGLLPTRIEELGVDFYVSGTLKWLFGGPGTAFLWVRPWWWMDDLRPTTTGWFSQARQFDFDVAHLGFATDARRFELGTPSIPSAAIARGGLELVREIGIQRLHERTADLGALTIELAREAGLRVRTLPDGGRAGIVTVAVAEPKPVVDALAERGVLVDFRPGIVRLSPAFYNSEEEVRQSVEALAELVPADERSA
jgi:selenocysteine lyase/cysteine desulfurase